MIRKANISTSESYGLIFSVFIRDTFSVPLQFHFINSAIEIIESYTHKSETIDLSFWRVYCHEVCGESDCKKLPCCTNEECNHGLAQNVDILTNNISRSEATIIIHVLIHTLATVFQDSPHIIKKPLPVKLEPYRSKIEEILNELIHFRELAPSSVRALIRMNSHVPTVVILQWMKDSLTDVQYSNELKLILNTPGIYDKFELNSLIRVGLQSLKMSSSMTDIILKVCIKALKVTDQYLDFAINFEELFSISCMYYKFYVMLVPRLFRNWRDEIEEITNRLEILDHSKKRLKLNSGYKSLSYDLSLRKSRHYSMNESLQSLHNLLNQCIEYKTPELVLFWYAVSSSPKIEFLFKQLNTAIPRFVSAFIAHQGRELAFYPGRSLKYYTGLDWSFTIEDAGLDTSDITKIIEFLGLVPLLYCKSGKTEYVKIVAGLWNEVGKRSWKYNSGFRGGTQFRIAMRNMARALLFFSEHREKRENIEACVFKEKVCVYCGEEVSYNFCKNKCTQPLYMLPYSDNILQRISLYKQDITYTTKTLRFNSFELLKANTIPIKSLFRKLTSELCSNFSDKECINRVENLKLQEQLIAWEEVFKMICVSYDINTILEFFNYITSEPLKERAIIIFPDIICSISPSDNSSTFTYIKNFSKVLPESSIYELLSRLFVCDIIKSMTPELLDLILSTVFQHTTLSHTISLSIQVISNLMSYYNISYTDLIKCVRPKILSNLLKKTLIESDFFVYMYNYFSPDGRELMITYSITLQSYLFRTNDCRSEEIYEIFRLLSRITNTQIPICATDVLASIAISGSKENLHRFQELGCMVYRKSNLNFAELWGKKVDEYLHTAVLFFLSRLVVSDKLYYQWRIGYTFKDKLQQTYRKLNLQSSEKLIPKLYKGLAVIFSIFHENQMTCTQIFNSKPKLDYTDIIKIFADIEETVLPDDDHKLGLLVSVAMLSLEYLNSNISTEYFSHKFILQILYINMLDSEIALSLLLHGLANNPNKLLIHNHGRIILMLTVLSSETEAGRLMLNKLNSEISKEMIKRMNLEEFICYPFMHGKTAPKIISRFLRNLEKQYESVEEGVLNSMKEGIVCNIPIIQRFSLEYLNISNINPIHYDQLIFAINTAMSLQSSRDEMNENPFKLGQLLSKIAGRIGALAPQMVKEMSLFCWMADYEYGLNQVLENYVLHKLPRGYIYLEKLKYAEFHSLKIIKSLNESSGILEEQAINKLHDIYYIGYSTPEAFPSYAQVRGLKPWVKWILNKLEMNEILPYLPLISINLDLISDILPFLLHQLMKETSSSNYLSTFLTDFFKKASNAHKRLMLQVLDRTEYLQEAGEGILSKIEFNTMFNTLIDLREYPRALRLLEIIIRYKFVSSNVRLKPELLTETESRMLSEIYMHLKKNRYIEEVPEATIKYTYKDSIHLEAISILRQEFRNGNYTLLVSQAEEGNSCSEVIEMVLGSCWRLARFDLLKRILEKHSEFQLAQKSTEVLLAIHMNQLSRCEDEISLNVERDRAREEIMTESKVRCAAYPQAYEEILLFHIIHNLQLIDTNQDKLHDERNSLLDNRFEYIELVLRSSLTYYKLKRKSAGYFKMCRLLLKKGFLYQEYEYIRNFLNELTISHTSDSYILAYYSFKLQYIKDPYQLDLINKVHHLITTIPSTTEIRPQDGDKTLLEIRYKFVLLYVKMYCDMIWDISISEAERIEYELLTHPNEHLKKINYYIEKCYYVLGQHFDRVSKEERDGSPNKIISAIYYAMSLQYGHSKYSHSLTRALSLFSSIIENSNDAEPKIKPLKERLISLMQDLSEHLPLFCWGDRIYQLLSDANHINNFYKKYIHSILLQLFKRHPAQVSWLIYQFKDIYDGKLNLYAYYLDELKKVVDKTTYNRVANNHKMLQLLIEFSKKDMSRRSSVPAEFKKFSSCYLALPCMENFKVLEYPKHQYLYGANVPAFNEEPVLIEYIAEDVELIMSKAKPKKITIKGSDGKARWFLLKHEDKNDMRKESRIMAIIEFVNELLKNDPRSKYLNLDIQTFLIIAINPQCGIIEWVSDTKTLKSTISPLWKEHKLSLDLREIKNLWIGRLPSNTAHDNPEAWKIIQDTLRPVLHEHLDDSFLDANSWLKARTRFTRSLAVYSMLGYIIGLGDRHCDNILICDNFQLVFIDFDCVFNMGLMLPKPEVVPFRLTPELQDIMGIYGESGDFVHACEVALNCLKRNAAVLMSQFECFVKDPLHSAIYNPMVARSDVSPLNTLKIVEGRLKGRVEHKSEKQFPSTRHQVLHLIKEATDLERLRVMYHGWAPWM